MSNGKMVATALVWVVVIGICAVAWKYFVAPAKEEAARQSKQQEEQERLNHTELNYGIGSSEGSIVQRPDAFNDDLVKLKIKINFLDDGANYDQRLADLKSGKLQLASFTVDELIKASYKLGDTPAVIIAVTDVRRGADAAIPNIYVIVANRKLLQNNPNVVYDFMKLYFKTVYDSQKSVSKQDGIWQKNTLENYAYFGIIVANNIQRIEDIVSNITNALVVRGVCDDPTHGNPDVLYDDNVMRCLQKIGFSPGMESIRDDTILPVLESNLSSGEITKLIFAHGSTILTERSQNVLDELVKELEDWPQSYVVIQGTGDKSLALGRAKSAKQYLIEKGIDFKRVRTIAGGTTHASSLFAILSWNN